MDNAPNHSAGPFSDLRSVPRISIITPSYNEELNIPLMYDRLRSVLDPLDMDWEWLVIDDHSSDGTYDAALACLNPRVKVLRLSRNFGSHTAITCGLDHMTGDCAVILAADLQDPPEVISDLLAAWRDGSQVVWAVRHQRLGEHPINLAFSRLYYLIMRQLAGIREMPATGADFFLADRAVVDAIRRFGEHNTSLFALMTWMGFRQSCVTYDKQARLHGRSGWTLNKKIKLLIDSITAFSYLPIRTIAWTGFLVALCGILYAGAIVVNALLGDPVEGWSSLMVVVLVLSGMQMLMLGTLGEYLWRSLDESRRRPRYLIEQVGQCRNAPPKLPSTTAPTLASNVPAENVSAEV
jgi:polyisoprenyl-phosphate glycosyltransferase